MDKAFDRAATAVGTTVAEFVLAADRLVNLMGEDITDMSSAALSKYQGDVEAAMNAYDIARRALTGEDVSSA